MQKRSILFLSSILIISFFTLIYNENYREFKPQPYDINSFNSSNYNYTVNYIKIDGAATTNTSYSGNWTWAVTNFAWCSGSGVWGDPYLINNVSFNGGVNQHGLEIVNSQNSYFKIINSKGFSSSEGYAGFSFYSVSNGTLLNNSVSLNFNGIQLLSSSNCTILNNSISSNSQSGIHLTNSRNCLILRNIITNNNNLGLYLRYSNNCTIQNNVFLNSPLIVSSSFNNKIDITNKMDGKSIYYYEGEDSLIIKNISEGVFLLVNCSNSFVSNLNISYATSGIILSSCKNISIENVNVSFCFNYGILLLESYNCTLSHNEVSNNYHLGISLYGANNSTLNENQICYNVDSGVEFVSSLYCIFTNNIVNFNGKYGVFSYALEGSIFEGNNFSNNGFGLYLYYTLRCNFTSNHISENGYGIYIDQESTYNIIWLNYFNNNTISQAYDDGEFNIWSNSLVGNYWGDYIDKYPEAQNIRGIWDIRYLIGGSSFSVDRYPLVNYPPIITEPPKLYIIILVIVGVCSLGILGLVYKNKNIYRPYLHKTN